MPAIAPLVAAWKRRARNLPGPLAGTGEVSNGRPVQVELLVAGVWVDITDPYVMVRDDGGQISITYGIQGGEGSQTDRAQAQLQLKNGDGRFTPRNPSGAYYGLIGRNTQMRISVPDGNGGKDYQIWGEVTSWAPNWDASGNDVWCDVTVNGIMQRLAQGPAPERSVIYTAITNPTSTNLMAYWPMEDATGATSLAAALTSGSPMTWTGTPTLASYADLAASDPLPDISGAVLSGGVPKYADPTATQVRFLAHIPAAGLSDGKVLCSIDQVDYSAGSAQFWEVYYSTTDATNSLVLRTCASDGTFLGIQLPSTVDVRGRLLYVSVELQESGTAITRQLQLKDVLTGHVYSVSDSQALTQLTRVTKVQFGPAARATSGPASTQFLPGVAVGHCTVENRITAIDALGVRLNPVGEVAGRRIQRLCGEQAIAFDWVGDLDDTVALGAQSKQNLLTLAQESTLADGGLLYETTNVLGLGYRTRASLYSQDPAIVLDYTGFNLAAVPVPVEDDRNVQNRVTVTVAGVSQTYEATTGTLSTAAVGVYGDTGGVTLNLASTDDNTLLDQAAWRVHLGTVDEARYPQISVNLAHSSITPAMRRAILALRLGDRLQIINPPAAWLPPDTIDQLILGTSATITHFEHRITFVCAPASPYTVGYLDSTAARIDIDSQLLTAIGTGDTSIDVIPAAGQADLWTTDTAEFPFDLRTGGEVMRATACTPKVTDTFTRSVSSNWGTPDSGSTWTTTGGSASDYAVDGASGVATLSTTDVSRRTSITAAGPDFDLYCDITTSALATGDSLYGAVTARMQDSSTMYMARLEFTTSNTVVLLLRRLLADATTDLGTYTVPVTHVAGTYVRVRFQGAGSALKAKAWAATDALEPPEWHIAGTDAGISPAYSIGTRSIRVTGNTNAASVAIQYDNYRLINPQTMTVTRSINGVVKAHTAGEALSLVHPTPLAL
ncbi:hypothetical protein ACGFY9_13855 [Streptomyces sp. NPDC048504]|uniref:hypothetical protein n=1 Tax=Streptomyces sp. NPDC048504 TaxID=3365559 RepID=UPI0037132AC9